MLRGKTLILGVGAPKSGTSWLHSYLKGDARVAVSPIKELHFFDDWLGTGRQQRWKRRFVQRLLKFILESKGGRPLVKPLARRVAMNLDSKFYFEYFVKLATEQTQFFCEITPAYSVLPHDALVQMRDFLRSAGWKLKIVFMMRDPIERHWSLARHQARMSGERADFIKLLSREDVAMAGRYDLIIKNLRTVFDSDELVFVFFENLFSEDDRYLHEFCQKIGIDFMPGAKTNQINANRVVQDSLTPEERAAGLKTFATAYKYIAKEFGPEKPASWAA
jgi:hypothetical protein